ncbi:MAG: hypothetical protein IKZ86_08185, partial [Spirochaetaceae bacterium]|nr:hypothetical protein [Spirochaetaceae bacterium]
MSRYYYRNSIKDFLKDSENEILGRLSFDNSFDLNSEQKNAWVYEISIMKYVLSTYSEGQIIFEYSIPRLGKRVDVIVLMHGIVFFLEFKVGESAFLRNNILQVWDYS